MDSSIIKNKDKYKRPGVIEGESSIVDSDETEKDRAGIDGPYRGDQSARGLAPSASAIPELPSQCRILITKEASQCLDDMAARVGDGFEGGRISRPQIVSWILQQFAVRMTGADVEEIQSTYFDRIAYLESLLKRAKDTGVTPPELAVLFPGRGSGAVVKKKPGRKTKAVDVPA